MNIEEAREYCLSRKGASESLPFGDDILVFKIMGKMFAVLGLEPHDEGFMIIVKCDPDVAIDLREKYQAVFPGYHFNKKYWNSIYLEKDMDEQQIRYWIDHSIEEVVKKLPKKDQVIYRQN